jgi:hypothetical protein
MYFGEEGKIKISRRKNNEHHNTMNTAQLIMYDFWTI